MEKNDFFFHILMFLLENVVVFWFSSGGAGAREAQPAADRQHRVSGGTGVSE